MAHELVSLSLENLKEVRGGLVEAMFNKAMQRMAQDIEAAPELSEFRKVVIEVRAKPVCELGELIRVDTEFAVLGKVPTRVATAVTVLRSNTNGASQLMFNLDAQDEPNQHTLPFDDDGK